MDVRRTSERSKQQQVAGLLALITALAALLLLVSVNMPALQAAQKKVAGSIFSNDKGKFNILLDGKSVGQEEFVLEPSGGGWIAKGTTNVKPPEGPAAKVSGSLVMGPDGAPISYEWTSQADKTSGAKVLFANGVAKITLEMQGARPFEQDLSFGTPMVVVLDNNLYHQYEVLARMYDWTKKGVQTYSVLIPQELTPGTVTVESVGSATSDGKSYEGLKVVSQDLEVLLLLDKDRRLMRLEAPAAKVAVVRE